MCVHTPYIMYQSIRGAVGSICFRTPAAHQGNMFYKCFLITNTIYLIWGLFFASAESVLLLRLSLRSKRYLSEHFHFIQINSFAVSESLLSNWVVLIEVTAF